LTVDSHRFEKNDVAQHPFNGVLVLHRAAAIFDDKQMAAVFLDIRKRLDQNIRAK